MPRLVPCPSCRRHLFAAEPACPHCGTSGSSFLAAVAVAVAASVSACSPPAADVYGPAPRDPDQRQPPSASATTDAHPPSPPADVYGPPPRDPDQRDAPDASSQPSSSTTTSASAPPKAPITVYGPPPQKPDDRLPPKQPSPNTPKPQ